MAKRYTSSDKWKTQFIRGLKSPYKLFWLYLWDECDHAGIWEVDFETANIKTGEKLIPEKAIEQLRSSVVVCDNGKKWFIPEFVIYQYKELKRGNKVHDSIIDILYPLGLLDE